MADFSYIIGRIFSKKKLPNPIEEELRLLKGNPKAGKHYKTKFYTEEDGRKGIHIPEGQVMVHTDETRADSIDQLKKFQEQYGINVGIQ